jgi:hypothetical protein
MVYILFMFRFPKQVRGNSLDLDQLLYLYPGGISKNNYLHHQKKRVKNNEDHDEVLEWCRHHHLPHLVLETVHFFGHVTLQWSCLDGKVNARFLQIPESLNLIDQYLV